MALISPATLDAIFISFNKLFQDAMLETPVIYDRIATTVPSGTRDQRYPFVAALSAAMREWVGPRVVQNMVLDGVVITNKKYESTLSLQRTDVEDDQYEIFGQMSIPLLAKNAKSLPDREISAAISANGLAYDGVSFFDGYHPVDPSGAHVGAGTQKNNYEGLALNSPNLAKVRAGMMSMKDPAGVPLGVNPKVLMVPPSLEFTAMSLANAAFFPTLLNAPGSATAAGATSNVWQGAFEVVVNPYLEDTGDVSTAVWYLLDTGTRGSRPFIWQQRVAPEFTPRINPADPAVFDLDIFLYGVRARGAAGLGLYFLAARANHAED